MADISPYENSHDFHEIRDYIDYDPEGFEVPFESPNFDVDFSNAIVVDNLPNAPFEKITKMKEILLKIYVQIDDTLTVESMYMPVDEQTRSTLGFCFIICADMQTAKNCIERTNGQMFGKKNQMRVCPYKELLRLGELDEEYAGFSAPKFNPRPDPTEWLTDAQSRDQFVIRHGIDTMIHFGPMANDEEPECAYDGARQKADKGCWCQSYVQWSPNGTFLATFHKPGVLLWGGQDFHECRRLIHDSVAEIAFSPCENYIITYRDGGAQPSRSDPIIVWSIAKGEMLRSFDLVNPVGKKFQVEAVVTEEKAMGKSKVTGEDKGSKKVDRLMRGRVVEVDSNCFTIREDNGAEHVIAKDQVRPLQDPNRLKWSPDGKYVAKIGVDVISVYQLPEMVLLDRKSIPAPNVLDFQWSPASNRISYYVPASGNHPALINIIEIPSRKDVCSRKAFDVVSGRMCWHGGGQYLGVFMTKQDRKNKSYVVLFFRVDEPSVPVEMLELQEKVLHMSWEPDGDRLAIVSGEPGKANVTFYSMGTVQLPKGSKANPYKKELHKLFALSEKKCTEVIWSPAGHVCVLASFQSDGCAFEFYDVTNNVSMASRRHDMCRRLVWDPSGRFLVSCTIRDILDPSTRTLDDGYHLYSFQGVQIATVRKERLHQFQWRPRPKNLLTKEEKKNIVKNLRKYEREFDKEDRNRKNEALEAVIDSRRDLAAHYLVTLARNRAAMVHIKMKRIELRDGFDEDADEHYELEKSIVETVIAKKKH